MKDEELTLLKSILWDLTDLAEDAMPKETRVRQRLADIRRKLDKMGRAGK